MGRPVEKKRKKKGRPSLLDLEKRSLRLQQQQQEEEKKKGNPNPSPNPYLRFPNNAPSRRITRRNSNPETSPEVRDEEEEEEEGSGGKRREKKLKLVNRIPDSSEKSPRHSGPSASESEGEGSGSRTKRKIESVGGDRGRSKAERHSFLKATVPLQAETSDLGPTTPLPDKKLLLFILDRLQKKDTYGVFSEPVDPEELPDYHEVIEHPMDFSTVRKKLSRGAYKNLEQFEKDVFLISSNAMSYNAPDTIYYRQARSIQELANKSFENLRQESDNEPETRMVARRGRPPSKTIKQQPVAQPSAVPTALDSSSDPILANPDGGINLSDRSHALGNKGLANNKPGSTEVSARSSYTMHRSDSFGWIGMNKVDASEQHSGSSMGISTKFGKKNPIVDESSRRNTYKQIQPYTYACELPILSVFDGEKRRLAVVGLHIEYAYARSLSRFAAHLGTVGWAIAAKKIEKSLPPGTRFGRGWIGDNEVPRQSHPPTQSASLSCQSSQATISPCSGILKGNNKPSQNLEPSCSDMSPEGVGRSTPLVSSPASGGRSLDIKENSEGPLEIPTTEDDMQLKSPFHIHQNQVTQTIANGFTSGFRFNLPSQAAGYMMRPARPSMPFGPQPPVMHSRTLDMASRNSSSNKNTLFIQTHSNHLEGEKIKLAGTSNTATSSSNPRADHKHDAPAQFRGSSMPAKLESIPPDLNVRFQSPASPASSAMLDSQQPDLALQL